MFSVEPAALVQVPAPVRPVATLVLVIVPLLVVVPLLTLIGPESVKLAAAAMDLLLVIVSVALFVTDPVPVIVVPAPLSEIAPVPLTVPLTVTFPATPRVNVDVFNVHVAVRAPFSVRLPPSLVVLALIVRLLNDENTPAEYSGVLVRPS